MVLSVNLSKEPMKNAIFLELGTYQNQCESLSGKDGLWGFWQDFDILHLLIGDSFCIKLKSQESF